MLFKSGLILRIVFTLSFVWLFQALGWEPIYAAGYKEIPVKGLVNLIDLGADSCLPCKMMAPIMTKLEKNYKGKAVIIFIDVWKFPDQAKRFNVKAIPTQIFYDKTGKEIYRHMGFMSEGQIVHQLKKMGVD
jgi:thioredoxin 1